MSQAILKHVTAECTNKAVPVLKAGYTVRIHQRIKEGNKERVQIFEGLVIRTNSGSGTDSSFTVRKTVDGVGVERTFPLYATSIEKSEVVKAGKVRRAKLYYMRERSGKSARLREVPVGEVEMIEPPVVEEAPVEEVAEEAAPEQAEAPVTEEAATEETATTEEAPAEEEAKAEEPAAEEATDAPAEEA